MNKRFEIWGRTTNGSGSLCGISAATPSEALSVYRSKYPKVTPEYCALGQICRADPSASRRDNVQFFDVITGHPIPFPWPLPAGTSGELPKRLAVIADPELKGKHLFHDTRYIVTEGAAFEEGSHPGEWLIDDGQIIATMRDVSPDIGQRIIACWNACNGINPEAVPELLRSLVALYESVKLTCRDEDGHALNDSHLAARDAIIMATKGQEHLPRTHGPCPVCGHYGEDCTANQKQPSTQIERHEMKTTNSMYGYAITTTPGLIQDGRHPLSAHELVAEYGAKGITMGKHDPEAGMSDIAVWETREEAESVMRSIVPEGSTPASFAGLSVHATIKVATVSAVYGWLVGQNGFRPPLPPPAGTVAKAKVQ